MKKLFLTSTSLSGKLKKRRQHENIKKSVINKYLNLRSANLKFKIFLLLLFTINFSLFTVKAATNYVSLSGSHVSPFTSWATAATNIQDAVDAATTNDVVMVTNGTYLISAEIKR